MIQAEKKVESQLSVIMGSEGYYVCWVEVIDENKVKVVEWLNGSNEHKDVATVKTGEHCYITI